MYIGKFKGIYMKNMSNMSNTSTVQSDRMERVYLNLGILKTLFIFFLFIAVIAVLFVLWILKGASFMPEDIREIVLDTVVCDSCREVDSSLGDEQYPLQTISQKNSSWAQYRYPDYDFSVELPSDSYFHPSHTGAPYRYVWNIFSYDGSETSSEELPTLFPNFSKRIVISFLPMNMPQDIATEMDYFGGTTIFIDFFEKEESTTIEDIEEQFRGNVTDMIASYEGELTEYSTNTTTFGNQEGFEYSYTDNLISSTEGVILLSDEYIVNIDKSFIYASDEILETTERVLSSMKF
jgi:hypothetical protein